MANLVPLRVAGALSGCVFVPSVEDTTVLELKQEIGSLLGGFERERFNTMQTCLLPLPLQERSAK